MIVEVPCVIDLRVQQFHVEINAMSFGVGRHAEQSADNRLERVLLALSGVTVSAETDQTGNLMSHGYVNGCFEFILDPIMVGGVIQAVAKGLVTADTGQSEMVALG